jgi:signal transduction histidine kinase/ActR/RegA family two-component response regulator
VKAFRDRSIGQKLTLVGMLASLVALAAASVAFLAYEFFAFRDEIVRRLSVDSEIVGANTVSALLFNDPEAAARTVAALGAEPHVRAAGVYDAQGHPFATYRREGGDLALPPVPEVTASHRFGVDSVELFRPIVFQGGRVGTVYIMSDLGEMRSRLGTFLAIMGLACLGSFLLALYISTRMQRLISAPLLRLADTARAVSRDRDYSVRAAPAGADEVGTLIATFNEMLDQIRRRDAELEEARVGLEQRVLDRTAALRKSQAQLEEAQRIAHIGSWERELATDALTWSDEMYRIYDVEPGSPIPSRTVLHQRVHPGDLHLALERADQAVKDGRPFSYDFRLLRPDGTVRVLHAEGRVVHDDGGTPQRLVGTLHDVTERNRAEEERVTLVREQAARAEAEQASRRAAFLAEAGAALGSSLDVQATLATLARLAVPQLAEQGVVFTQTADGELRPAAAEHADPALQDSLWERARAAGPLSAAARDAITAGRPRQSADDEGAVVLATPLRARDHTFGALVLVSSPPGRRIEPDLSVALGERAAVAADNARLYREAQQANRMKDEFLATLSHELRTPLNAIVGWAHILRDTAPGSDTAKRAVDTIVRSARAQDRLISDILDVSRIIAGKIELNVSRVDLPALIEAAHDTIRPAAEAKDVTVPVALDTALGPFWGDPQRLQQVVLNLLTNAIKFAPRGGRVQVTLTAGDPELVITVEDDGPGINPDFLPHVFERFRQADSSATRRHGGLGLGLAIARHLTELHHGTISAANRQGGPGAVFTIRLPRHGLHAEVPQAVTDPTGETPAWAHSVPDLSGIKVLVVDDETDARDLVATTLRRCGATVLTASSAAEAFDLLRRERPHALLSDIGMPEEDGLSLLRKVRSLPADQGGQTPAAALTAYASPEDRVSVIRAGFQSHIPKPVHAAELAAVVASLVAGGTAAR